jgi:hypothetical protein
MKSNIVLILIMAFVLFGCSVYSELYLRNTTTIEQQITLVSRESIQGKRFEFLYSDSLVKKIKYKTYNYLDKKVTFNGQNKTVTFSMPSNSTLHLGAGRNFQKQFEKMIIATDTFDLNSTGRFQTSYEKLSKYAVWFDIK